MNKGKITNTLIKRSGKDLHNLLTLVSQQKENAFQLHIRIDLLNKIDKLMKTYQLVLKLLQKQEKESLKKLENSNFVLKFVLKKSLKLYKKSISDIKDIITSVEQIRNVLKGR